MISICLRTPGASLRNDVSSYFKAWTKDWQAPPALHIQPFNWFARMSPEQLPELLSKARKAPVSATRPCLVMPSPTPRGRIRAKPSVWPRNMQRFVLEPNTAAGQVHSDRTATVYSDRTAYLSSIALTGFLESPARILATRASRKHLTNEKQSDKALTGPGRRDCGRVTHKQRQRQH
jgi:hypothetical protein